MGSPGPQGALGPRWGGQKMPVADFLYYMLDRIEKRIQGLAKVQSPLLTRPVEQVARPATVVCLCCRGWVGDRAQEFVYEVPPVLAPARRNRTGVSSQNCAADLVHFSLLLVQFLLRATGATEGGGVAIFLHNSI